VTAPAIAPVVRAPRGATRTARGWIQEAAKRMLMNNLDPEVAEHPEQLIVYGGRGKAARDWESYHRIVRTLDRLGDDETLLVQSGKPVAVLETHPMAPRVLIANSNLVPKWATWEEFDRLDALGLMMYGQMTAGSWIYIGTQGILQGTYETFAAAAARHFGGTLAGTITLTAGLGGMGGAQPLAVTMAGGVALCVEVDPSRIRRRLDTRYLDEAATSLEDAVRRAERAKRERRALSVGLLGNAAEVLPRLVALGFTPDLVTDQTSAHDPMIGYLPPAGADEDVARLRAEAPAEYLARARDAMAAHVRAILEMRRRGAVAFDYGNNLRAQARIAGVEDAFDYPGFVPAFIRDSFCEGRGPFRWVALSGDPADIAATDRALLDLFPDDARLQQWVRLGGRADRVPGAAGAHLLARLPRARPRGAAVQRDGARRSAEGARGHRPRPPRRGLGGESVPRDRRHARRVGRGERLAAAQLRGRRGERGGVDELPPRRRGGDGVQPARRPRGGGRRLARGGRAAAAVPDERPGDGGCSARGRGVRHGAARGAGAGVGPAECGRRGAVGPALRAERACRPASP